MKRYFIMLVVIVCSFILQSTVFQTLALSDIVPNLLIIITVSVGYMRGQKEAMCIGLTCGLLYDCIFGEYIGLYSMFFLTVGFLIGYSNLLYYKANYVVFGVLVAVGDFIYNFLCYICCFLFRGRFHFLFYLKRIIIPEMIYTILVSLQFYRFLQWLNEKIEHMEKKEG